MNKEKTPDAPDEIHLVSFPSEGAFIAYRDDPERLNKKHLLEASVEKAVLWEGYQLI